MLFYAVVSLLALAVAWAVASRARGRLKVAVPSGENVLIVIAHPDDETMFFAPFILACLEQRCQVHVLCLSTGNAEGTGQARRKELIDACSTLGIQKGNVFIVDHQYVIELPCLTPRMLQDGMQNDWDVAVIQALVREHVQSLAASIVCHLPPRLTLKVVGFDESGVSGHPNHCSTSKAIKALGAKFLPSMQHVLLLQTLPLVAKYTAFLSALTSGYVTSEHTAIATSIPEDLPLIWMTWYRMLYLVFSRYVFINTFDVHGAASSPRPSLSAPASAPGSPARAQAPLVSQPPSARPSARASLAEF